jgi:type VII secretion-associated serine protease mycosin
VTRRRIQAVIAIASAITVLLPCTPAHADAVRDAQWYLGFLRVLDAHKYSEGDGIMVGLVDTGVDAAHPDLTGNVLRGTDLIDAGGDGLRDEGGHGTAMAALIAGHGHGGGGILGVAPKAKILPARSSRAELNFLGRESQGIDWVAQHGAKVISLSFSGGPTPQLEQAVEDAQAADIVVVAGVGNAPRQTTVGYSAAYPGVVAVAGVDRSGNHAAVSAAGPEVMVAAPAVDVETAGPGGTYGKGTGTSEATAIVAGVAALVRAKYPQLSAAEVVHRLTATAIDKGTPGRDNEYGYGIVDPVAALTADVPPLQPSASPITTTPTTSAAAPPDTAPRRTAPVIAIAMIGLVIVAGGTIALVALARRRSA